MADRPGGTLDGWALEEQLGQGAMGTVWRARHLATGRPAALKLVRDGPDRAARLAREAELAARLDHPGIVRVLAASGPASPRPWVAFELLERATPLQEVWSGLDRVQRVSLLRDVARAVGHAHARGVVHRDLKPENVLVDASGLARVADFGLATADDVDRLTRSGVLLGTPIYMALELVAGKRGAVGPPTDVWALGVMLHEALVDRPPFEAGGSFLELARQITSSPPAGPRSFDPGVPPALDALVLSCLAADPRDRPRDGEALAAALDQLLATGALLGGGGQRPARGRHARAGGRRRLRLAVALGSVVALGLVAVGLAVRARRDDPPRAVPPPTPPTPVVAPNPARLPGLVLAAGEGLRAHLGALSLDVLVAGADGSVEGLAFEVAPGAGLGGSLAVRRLIVARTTDLGATWSLLAAKDFAPGTNCVGATLLRAPDGRRLVVATLAVDRPLKVDVMWGEVDALTGTIESLRPVFDPPTQAFTPFATLDAGGFLVVASVRHDGHALLRRQTAVGWDAPVVFAPGGQPVTKDGSSPFGVAVDADDRVRVVYAARRGGRRGLYARTVVSGRPLDERLVDPELAEDDHGGGAVLDAAGRHHVAYRRADGARVVASIPREGQPELRVVGLGEDDRVGVFLGPTGPEALVGDAGGLVRVSPTGLFPFASTPVSLPGPAAEGHFAVLRRAGPGVGLAVLRLATDPAGRSVLLGHVLPPAPPAGARAGTVAVHELGRWPKAVSASPLDPGLRSVVVAGDALLALGRVDQGLGVARVELFRSDDRGATWRALETPGGVQIPLYGALLPARDGASVQTFIWGAGAAERSSMSARTYDVVRDAWTGPPEPVMRERVTVANATLDPRGEPVLVYGTAEAAGGSLVITRRRGGAFGAPASLGARGAIDGFEIGADDHLHLLLSASQGGTTSLRYLRLDATLDPVVDELVLERVTGARGALALDDAGAALAALSEPGGLTLVRWPVGTGATVRLTAPFSFKATRPRVALAFDAAGPVLYSTDGARLLRARPDPDGARLVVEVLDVPGARDPLVTVAVLLRPGQLVESLVVLGGATGEEGGARLLVRTVR